MYNRIMESAWHNRKPVQWRVYSKDFREVLSVHDSFESAKQVIDLEIQQARACPSCED